MLLWENLRSRDICNVQRVWWDMEAKSEKKFATAKFVKNLIGDKLSSILTPQCWLFKALNIFKQSRPKVLKY
jgi:hypothetical protein